jgi:hypothetical protein
MSVRPQPRNHVSAVDASPRQWLQLRTFLTWLATASLVCGAGCAGSIERAAGDTSETDEVAADQQTQAALHKGAFATPETLGGFSADGVGVLLSAVNNTAELTLYVAAPAQSATFERPALYTVTEVAEFDDVTIDAGQSRVFSKEAGGKLMEAFADFASSGQ